MLSQSMPSLNCLCKSIWQEISHGRMGLLHIISRRKIKTVTRIIKVLKESSFMRISLTASRAITTSAMPSPRLIPTTTLIGLDFGLKLLSLGK